MQVFLSKKRVFYENKLKLNHKRFLIVNAYKSVLFIFQRNQARSNAVMQEVVLMYNNARMYRAIRRESVADSGLYAAWSFSYFNERTGGWRTVRNYNMRQKLKQAAQDAGKVVSMFWGHELNGGVK